MYKRLVLVTRKDWLKIVTTKATQPSHAGNGYSMLLFYANEWRSLVLFTFIVGVLMLRTLCRGQIRYV